MVLLAMRFSTFFAKISPIFHKNDSDSHEIPRKTQNILQIRPENHENRPPRTPPRFSRFSGRICKIFCVFRGISWNRSHFYEKLARFFVEKMSKIGEHHCSLLSTGWLACPVLFDFDDFWVEFVKYFVFFGIFMKKWRVQKKVGVKNILLTISYRIDY
jgi:hypothetical protein